MCCSFIVFFSFSRTQEPEIDSLSEGGLRPEEFKGNIKLSDVIFHYPARPTVQVQSIIILSVCSSSFSQHKHQLWIYNYVPVVFLSLFCHVCLCRYCMAWTWRWGQVRRSLWWAPVGVAKALLSSWSNDSTILLQDWWVIETLFCKVCEL